MPWSTPHNKRSRPRFRLPQVTRTAAQEKTLRQPWASWWHQQLASARDLAETTFPTSASLHLGYNPETLARLADPQVHQTFDNVLHFARREAWKGTLTAQPTLHWITRLTSASGIAIRPLQIANVVANISDAMEADNTSRPVLPRAHVEGLDTPSILLLKETSVECCAAIAVYLARHANLPLSWSRQRGLSQALPPDSPSLPGLERDKHSEFLSRLIGRLPGGFAKLDASRPWMFYWVVNSLKTMGLDFDRGDDLLQTVFPIQNPGGGFGGGQTQYSHLATTYATVLALVASGVPAASLNFIDRRELYEWLGRLKQHNGAFAMAEGGETDVRAVYIVLVLISLFNLPHTLPATSSVARAAGHVTFEDGVGAYIGACQSFEGGIGCNPSTEAHGAYTFCGLAALCLLDPWHGPKAVSQYVDMDALLQWVMWRQEDISGGLTGRTNKLVDNCYSHWIGGCWTLLEAVYDDSPDLFNRDALALYIVACGQAPYGGLRDKPSKDSDAYHSCYGLAGLSMTAYRWKFEGGHWSHAARRRPSETFSVRPLHPVYITPVEETTAVQKYFELRPLAH